MDSFLLVYYFNLFNLVLKVKIKLCNPKTDLGYLGIPLNIFKLSFA